MALVLADRVQETTATTGTGTITTAGAVAGFQTFFAGVGSGNTTYYCLLSGNGTDWETGLGTVTTVSGTVVTITRGSVISSSAGGAAISLVGTSVVFCDLPASKISAASLETYYSGSNTGTTSGTLAGSYAAIPNCSMTLVARSYSRVFSVSGSATWANGSHAMRGGVLLDGNIIFPQAMTSNPGFQNVTGGVDGAIILTFGGVIVTVPGDNATHVIAFGWQPSGSTSSLTMYDRSVTAIQVG